MRFAINWLFRGMTALFWASILVAAASPFRAIVDKTTIANGETLTLKLEFHGQTEEEPDFGELERQFTIVSRQQSSEITDGEQQFYGENELDLANISEFNRKNGPDSRDQIGG